MNIQATSIVRRLPRFRLFAGEMRWGLSGGHGDKCCRVTGYMIFARDSLLTSIGGGMGILVSTQREACDYAARRWRIMLRVFGWFGGYYCRF
ncbi:MAG: hypothetical protein ACLU4N_26290 [Butyricimonas faecihominis]